MSSESRRTRKPTPPDVQTNILLPEATKDVLKNRTRRHLTGADHVLGAQFLAAAYVLAVEEIIEKGELDLWGVTADKRDVAVKRVLDSIRSSIEAGIRQQE